MKKLLTLFTAIRNCSSFISLGFICAQLTAFDVSGEEPVNISNQTIAGGGGSSAGGNYSLSGTIGQPVAMVSSGGNYVVEAGFWNLYTVIQTPGAPALSVTRSGNTIVITWPTQGSAGYLLESTMTIGAANSWSDAALTPVLDSGFNKVTITISPGAHFYRLRKP